MHPGSEGPSAPARRRILVVDDNRDATESLSMLLGFMGHEVHVAHDGPGALEAARAHRPEIVLLDLALPGMSGFEVATRMRGELGMDSALLVAVTGWERDEDRRRSQEAGFDHHLVKPLDPEAIEALLATDTRR